MDATLQTGPWPAAYASATPAPRGFNPWMPQYAPQGYNGGGSGGVPDTVGPDYMSGPEFNTGDQFYNTFLPRLQPDRNAVNSMRAYKNAQNLKQMLAEKVRVATANAQAADAAHKLALFGRMTPGQVSSVYGSAPTTDAQATIDRTIADAENGGNAGFAVGWDQQRQNQIDREREAQLQRLNRDSDLNYQIRLGKEDQDNRLFDLQSQRVGTQQQREDRLQATQESRANSGLIKSAIEAVTGGTVHPDDVRRLFPELSPTELQLVRNYGNQYQGDVQAENSQARGVADYWNERLLKARETVAQGGSLQAKQAAVDAVMKEMAKARANSAIIYDPQVRSFVPIKPSTSPRLANGQPASPFYMPSVSGASPSHAVPQTSTGSYGPTQASPLLNAFDILDRSGATPADRDVQTLNSRFPNAREGQSVNNGQFVFRSGQWMRLR